MALGLLTASLRTLKNLKDVDYDKVLGTVASRLVDVDGDFSHITQRKSRMQLVLLSCAVCGIEFCYAAETAFVSPTLLQIGVPSMYMTFIWCISPLLGFLLVPLLGSLSDKCSSRMGRRRPFILLLSAGIIIGLLLVPNGKAIGVLLGDVYTATTRVDRNNITEVSNLTTGAATLLPTLDNNVTEATTIAGVVAGSHMWSILFTCVGVVLLDLSCDACQSPCRAYLLDVTVSEDHSLGLSTFTILAGLGGTLGYVMGGINWGSIGDSIGGHVKVVFTSVLVIYIVCLTLTLTSIKEVPLKMLGISKEHTQKKKKKEDGQKYQKFTNDSSDEEEMTVITRNKLEEGAKAYGAQGDTFTSEHTPSQGYQADSGHTVEPNGFHSYNQDIQVPSSQTTTCDSQSATASKHVDHSLPLPSEVSLKTYLISIIHMPRSLVMLCVTNLFCWMSLVCYSLYFTDFVGQAVYGGDPTASRGSPQFVVYEQGVRTGSFAMALYSLSCAVYSMCLEKLVSKFGARPVYVGSQLVYTVGALLMAVIRHPAAVILLSPCAGIMYATLFTMPYILLAHYHSHAFSEEGMNRDEESKASTRSEQIRGLGTDVAVVSSMVFVAQFLLSACMGPIVSATSTVAVVVMAAVLSLCGAVCATQVLYLGL